MQEKRILFVDDDEEVGRAILAVLGPWAAEKGIGLLVTNSALSALDILERDQRSIAAVVSDVRMPQMSGTDLALKVRERYPDMALILLSAYQDIPDLLTAIRAGVHSYVTKPFHLEFMKAELEKALDFNRMREENKSYLRRLQEEMKWAGELQKKILHVDPPSSKVVRYEITYRPFLESGCGGDFYDVWELGPDKHLVLIGDVAGHGLRSAFVTILLKSLVRTYVRAHKAGDFSTAAFLSWLNEHVRLELDQAPDLLITFAACLLDLANLRMLYSNAGHPPVYLLREDVQGIHLPGTTMGFERLIEYRQQEYALKEGDLIVLYTDGITETFPVDASRGSKLLEEAIVAARGHELVNPLILERIQVPNRRIADDVTLVSVKIL